MIYLEKKEQSAIDFVSKFIHDNWLKQNDENYKYQNIGYEHIKNPAKKFKEFFITEQNNQCCYCCRKIVNNKTTQLEHIIPRSKSDIDEFSEYYKYSNILKENVVPQNTFEESETEIPMPPYPHHIAYHNIVASCNGETIIGGEHFTCCNRNRKDEFVPPFNLMADSIQYLPDGTIIDLKDEADRTHISRLNLSKPILMKIRRLWYLFSRSQLTLDKVMDENYMPDIREKIVVHAIASSPTIVEDNNALTETFSIPSIWNSFKDYSFFYKYYKRLV